HQAKPDSWDLTHGRIYKIQPTGTRSTPPGDLARRTSAELVELLRNNNPWWHRTALRLLGERRDASVGPSLSRLLFESEAEPLALRGLWGLYALGAFDDDTAEKALKHPSRWVRSWAVRLLGERGKLPDRLSGELVRLAAGDAAPEVRLQLASTAQR